MAQCLQCPNYLCCFVFGFLQIFQCKHSLKTFEMFNDIYIKDNQHIFDLIFYKEFGGLHGTAKAHPKNLNYLMIYKG